MNFIGRRKEIDLLSKIALNKQKTALSAFLIGLKGRRRVGKTSLVEKFVEDFSFINERETVFFNFIGNQHNTSKDNLNNCIISLKFYIEKLDIDKSLKKHFLDYLKPSKTWLNLFLVINEICQKLNQLNKTIVLFLDEICWFSKKDNFVSQFQSCWNSRLVHRENLICFMAGSNISWMDSNLFLNTKEFYNRIDLTLEIEPFTLLEISKYLKNINPLISYEDIIKYYSIFGGIIKYYNLLDLTKNFDDNFSSLLKDKNKKLILEQEKQILFDSLFSKNAFHQEIIQILCVKKSASISDIVSTLKEKKKQNISDNKNISNYIYKDFEELEQNKMIVSNKNNQSQIFSLNDNFSYFFYYWFELNKKDNFNFNDSNYDNWKGTALEILVLNRIEELIGNNEQLQSFSKVLNFTTKLENGINDKQIDLIVKKDDIYYTLIEVKNYNDFWTLSENEVNVLLKKLWSFENDFLKCNQNSKGANPSNPSFVNFLLVTLNGSKSKYDFKNDNIYKHNLHHLCLSKWLENKMMS